MTTKKPKISLPSHPEGLLGIYWTPGPYGLALESSKDLGIGFFSADNQLLAVEFFDVAVKSDGQVLSFKNGVSVSLSIKNKKIEHINVIHNKPKSNKTRKQLNK
jgi:hypothetical protein